MHVQNFEHSPRNHRGGQVSYLLLNRGQFDSQNLSLTWVEGEPGSEQLAHSHPDNEQAYIIVRGQGLMTCGDEDEKVRSGSMVFVPPGTSHSIRNVGEEPLVYISATSPPFELPPTDSPFAYVPPT